MEKHLNEIIDLLHFSINHSLKIIESSKNTQGLDIATKLERLSLSEDKSSITKISNFDMFNVLLCFNNTDVNQDEMLTIAKKSITEIDKWSYIDSKEFITTLINLYDNQNSTLYKDAYKKSGLSPLLIQYNLKYTLLVMLRYLDFKNRVSLIESHKIKLKEKIPAVLVAYEASECKVSIETIINFKNMKQEKFSKNKEELNNKVKYSKELLSYLENTTEYKLSDIKQEWKENVSSSVLISLYELINERMTSNYVSLVDEQSNLEQSLNETPLIKYLYENNIDPKSIPQDSMEILKTLNIDFVIKWVDLLRRVGISDYEIFTNFCQSTYKVDAETLKKLSFFLDSGILKESTLRDIINALLEKFQIIETNYIILKPIIDFSNMFYDDSVLLKPTIEIKNTLSILAQYNLSRNIYMFLLCNSEYISLYDLALEKSIPLNHFINICRTANPLCTMKKIILAKELDIPFETDNLLLRKEIVVANKFICQDEEVESYLFNEVPSILFNEINGSKIEEVLSSDIIKSFDSLYQNQDKYVIDGVQISRPKFLRNMEEIITKNINIENNILPALITGSVLTAEEILKLKKALNKKELHL